MKKRWLKLFIITILFIPMIFTGLKPLKAAETSSMAVMDPQLTDLLKDAADPVQVIVTFKGKDVLDESQSDILNKIGITKGIFLKSLPMAGVLATKDQINELKNNTNVRSIYLNKKLSYYNAEATALTGVDKVRTDDGMRKLNGGLPVDGKGVGVLINDSGVDGTHKDLQYGTHLIQNVLGSTNLNSLDSSLLPVTYAEGVPNTDTNSGHGTHVAGIVGGTGAASGGKYEGVAPGASLIGYGSGATLLVLDGIGGFDYALTHQSQHNIRVITNSWGSSGDFDPNDPINIASKAAYDRGITVLFAAGNEGPGENTHNPYAKAPWVISVAAGDKTGKLADFSSRGTKGVGGTFEQDGKTWQWKDEPTVTAPGVDIISTRALAPVSSLGAEQDASLIEPAYLPYYTTMSGTSMATPHVAGIVALMLQANSLLSPDEIKQILQKTATNMPGYESWEVGVGYVNAYDAVDQAFHPEKPYGQTVNAFQTFNSNVQSTTTRKNFSVDYNPVTLVSTNQYEFNVESGLTSLAARVDVYGLLEQTGNPINLVLIAPDGKEYSSGVNLLFTLYPDRTVMVPSPIPGTWKVELRGLRGNEANPIGVGLPETVNGTLSFTKAGGYSGLTDISGHPAEDSIKLAVQERLLDGYSNGTFRPDSLLKRSELAHYLVMGAEIRQSLTGSPVFNDVSSDDSPFVSAVTSKGGAFRDKAQIQNSVMPFGTNGSFNSKVSVSKSELAYSLVQSLGLQDQATSFSGDLTVQYKDERLKLEDSQDIHDALKGYVQLALDLNILNAVFTTSQGPYDLQPTVHAYFYPKKEMTRGDFAVAIYRFYNAYLQ